MLDAKPIVINTGPLIALTAAWGDLSPLRSLYQKISVPHEVCEEINYGGKTGFAVIEFNSADFLDKAAVALEISPFLRNSLDKGEASVIQLALNKGIDTVCIDEPAGRRIARLHDLRLTGSVGILVRARQEGYNFSMPEAIKRMQEHGIYLSHSVIQFALEKGKLK